MRVSDLPGRPRFLLRDAADIQRLRLHLATHWKLPRVEVGIDKLPALDSQRAQHRFARLSAACNCLLGEMLGGLTLLGGCYAAWVWMQGGRDLWLVAVATLGAVLIGKGIELAWTRVRMLLVLRDLRHRLAEAVAGRHAATHVRAPDLVLTAGLAASKGYGYALNSEAGEVLPNNRIQLPQLPAGADRPRVVVRDARDINRLFLRLVTRWRLPRIEIHVDALPKLVVERAQDRLVRLSAGYNFMLAGVLACASLLSGMFYIAWTFVENYFMWSSSQGWRYLLLLLIVTLYAALAGCAIEILWVRLRLLLVLRGLRRRMRMA